MANLQKVTSNQSVNELALLEPDQLGDMRFQSILFTTAIDIDGNKRKAALLYNRTDDWYAARGNMAQMEYMHKHVIHLMEEDKTVKAYQTQAYSLENGIYRKGVEFYPSFKR